MQLSSILLLLRVGLGSSCLVLGVGLGAGNFTISCQQRSFREPWEDEISSKRRISVSRSFGTLDGAETPHRTVHRKRQSMDVLVDGSTEMILIVIVYT
jgi:hypothetical protein